MSHFGKDYVITLLWVILKIEISIPKKEKIDEVL